MDLKEAKEFNNEAHADRHPWELARFEIVYSFVCKYFNFKKKRNPIILDVGCGDSFFLNSLSQRLPESKLIGVDPMLDQPAISWYSNLYPKVNLYNSINNLETRNEFVDIVLLLDVLEHIKNDKDALQGIVQSRMINNSTVFFITVPAFQLIFSSHDRWLGHYRRYDLKSLSKVVEESSLRILDRGYFFLSLLFVRIITNFFKNNLSGNKGLADWRAPSFLTELVKIILCLDYRTTAFLNKFGFKIPGLSCYMICQKQAL